MNEAPPPLGLAGAAFRLSDEADTMEISIERLGRQEQKLVSYQP